MATLFKKQFTKPLPPDAKIVSRTVKDRSGQSESKQFAQWTDRSGKKRTAEVTTGKDGSLRIKAEAATWTAKYRDGQGIVQEVATGCTDKQAAMSVLNDLTTRAELVKAKVLSPEQDQIADFAGLPIADHIEAFLDYQRQKKTHPERVNAYKTRLYESAEACKFRTLCDLSVDRLEKWLDEQRRGDRNMSAAVYNGFRESWLAFGNWCIGKRTNRKQTHFNGEKRLIANPFDGMARLNEQAERRRQARALTESELTRLLEAARTRPLEHAMTVYRGKDKGKQLAKVSEPRRIELERLGHERALIYKTLVLTGLRANELRTLKIGDLSFGDVPFIRLQHANEKNRQGSTLALRSDLAVDLRKWIAGRERSEFVFNVPDGILRILNRDLKAAGIAKKVDDCVVHVHALRHSFGTHLSIAGVAPRVAQAAMRHSNISLTMGTYTDARLLDTAQAVESLPSLPIADQGTQNDARTLAPTLAPNGVQEGQNQSIPGNLDEQDRTLEKRKNPKENMGFQGVCLVGDIGLEPTTSTMSTLRSNQLS
jgi:integrase